MTDPVNIVCMKWGTLYGPEYVNRLYAMTQRNLTRPFRFICFTDDPSGFAEGIEHAPIPEMRVDPPYENTPWRKLALYAPELADLKGTALFMDLDVVVVGPLDDLFDLPGEYCIIHNWTHPNRIVGNSSVFRFEVGQLTELLDVYHGESTQHWVDVHRIEQAYLSHELGRERLTYWPDEWCISFKKHCLPKGPFGILNRFVPSKVPDGARVVVFHGNPNPDDALIGKWPENGIKACALPPGFRITGMTDVSYVITVYNKAWALPRVWDSLQAQTGEFTREFVFVDDASTDGSLDVLRGFAASDARVVIVENTDNAGPAIRLNQGAKTASGRWLHMLDGDDAIPPNASEWMMAALEDRNAPLLYGCRRVEDLAPIPESAEAQLIAEPLSFAAAKPITHIALMVARAVFMAAGGCDERIFIQDQSLPLRLGARIQTMLWTDATLACQPQERPGELSRNVKQQHHDRFFAAYNVLNSLPEEHEATDTLRRLCASARWKSKRDSGGLPWFSAAFFAYLRSRTGGIPSDDTLAATAEWFRAQDGVRRPG